MKLINNSFLKFTGPIILIQEKKAVFGSVRCLDVNGKIQRCFNLLKP